MQMNAKVEAHWKMSEIAKKNSKMKRSIEDSKQKSATLKEHIKYYRNTISKEHKIKKAQYHKRVLLKERKRKGAQHRPFKLQNPFFCIFIPR